MAGDAGDDAECASLCRNAGPLHELPVQVVSKLWDLSMSFYLHAKFPE